MMITSAKPYTVIFNVMGYLKERFCLFVCFQYRLSQHLLLLLLMRSPCLRQIVVLGSSEICLSSFSFHSIRVSSSVQVNVASIVLIWSIPTILYGVIPATGLGVYVYKCWQSMCNLGIIDLRYLTFLMLFSVTVFLATYAINGRIFYIARQQRAKLDVLEQQFQARTGDKLRFGARIKAARSVVTSCLCCDVCVVGLARIKEKVNINEFFIFWQPFLFV